MNTRRVLSMHRANKELVGHLETRTAIDGPDPELDPFLILGHHGPQVFGPHNTGMPFDDHPHRGFETVTFILDGAVVHTDSGGRRREVGRGGVQWMTAGAGIVHNEQVPQRFLDHGGSLEVLQLWINLPARLKATTPTYTGVQADGIVHLPLDDGNGMLHLVSGRFGSATGPIESLTGVFMSSVDLATGAHLCLPAPRERTVLLYVIRGSIRVDGQTAHGGDRVTFARDADAIEVVAASDATCLLAHADPIGETVVARGPFVMNSEEEIAQAFRDYRRGAFEVAA